MQDIKPGEVKQPRTWNFAPAATSPTDPAAQQRWDHLAGHLAAWRVDHQIDTDDTPLGPPPTGVDRAEHQHLARATR